VRAVCVLGFGQLSHSLDKKYIFFHNIFQESSGSQDFVDLKPYMPNLDAPPPEHDDVDTDHLLFNIPPQSGMDLNVPTTVSQSLQMLSGRAETYFLKFKFGRCWDGQ
jgi:hypothetical protein